MFINFCKYKKNFFYIFMYNSLFIVWKRPRKYAVLLYHLLCLSVVHLVDNKASVIY